MWGYWLHCSGLGLWAVADSGGHGNEPSHSTNWVPILDQLISYCSMDSYCNSNSVCSVSGTIWVRVLKHLDHGFESNSNHQCLRVYSAFALSCVWSAALRQGWSPVQGIHEIPSYRFVLTGKMPEGQIWKVQEKDGDDFVMRKMICHLRGSCMSLLLRTFESVVNPSILHLILFWTETSLDCLPVRQLKMYVAYCSFNRSTYMDWEAFVRAYWRVGTSQYTRSKFWWRKGKETGRNLKRLNRIWVVVIIFSLSLVKKNERETKCLREQDVLFQGQIMAH